jgi:hypothetical protein
VNRGIKRLGIIASVLWVVAGGIWNVESVEKARRDRVSNSYFSCTQTADVLHQSEEPCEKAMKAGFDALYSSSSRNDQLTEVLIGTLVPLVLAWLLAYVLTWLGKWVFAGFRSAK